MDFYLQDDPMECVSSILAEQPAIVGFSLYIWNRERCLELAAAIRRLSPGIILCAGGPEVTADPEGILVCRAFDFLIPGEGEVPFRQAMTRLEAGRPLTGITGVVIRGSSFTPASVITDLDELPSPYLSGTLDATGDGTALWQLSRGCSFHCDFCFDPKGDTGVRRFSLTRIADELRFFADNNVNQIFVLDSTFNLDMVRAKKILRMIAHVAPHIHFHFEVRSEFIDKEMAQLFASITCSLQIGLQSADPQVLKNVNRSFSAKDFASRIRILNSCGVVFGFDLIYGLPGDSFKGFLKSIDFAIGLYPNHLDIFPLALLPGTRLASNGAFGLEHLPTPPYTLVRSPTFTEAAMSEAAALATACDIFYTRGKAVAWFNSIITSLNIPASQFFGDFSAWLGGYREGNISESDLTDDEVWQVQRKYLTELFSTVRHRRVLPLVLDLVDYHYHYAAALLSTPPDILTEDQIAETLKLPVPLRLAPSARIAGFHYDVDDILDAGEITLASFVQSHPRRGSYAIIYPRGPEIVTESVDKFYFNLLKSLDGQSAFRTFMTRFSHRKAEVREFIEFALQEGIITRS
jgi:radical SAM superfamily enzyme YgiQ (UPF0313 family)